jgi:hypothetical protein
LGKSPESRHTSTLAKRGGCRSSGSCKRGSQHVEHHEARFLAAQPRAVAERLIFSTPRRTQHSAIAQGSRRAGDCEISTSVNASDKPSVLAGLPK